MQDGGLEYLNIASFDKSQTFCSQVVVELGIVRAQVGKPIIPIVFFLLADARLPHLYCTLADMSVGFISDAVGQSLQDVIVHEL
jgi:hypothetical protein